MRWHLLNDAGKVIATVDAEDKASASRRLGPGPVVSAISYEMDHRYEPVLPRTADGAVSEFALRKVDGATRKQQGYRTTGEVAALLGINRQRVRALARYCGLTANRITGKDPGFIRFVWSDEQVAKIRQYFAKIGPSGVHPDVIERRRQSLNEYHRRTRLARYLAKDKGEQNV